MQQIKLADTGRLTTRLGFGGGLLLGSAGRRESSRLLDAAFACGIRHFDTAPMYGAGEGEACLGRFLRRHRHEVTVTTKYGLLPPSRKSKLLAGGRFLARPVARAHPTFKAYLARKAATVAHPACKASFTPEEAAASLRASLNALQTDHVDLWLLHEARWDDLSHAGLLDYMLEAASSGLVGGFGVATTIDETPALVARKPEYCHVVQSEWTATQPSVSCPSAFRLHHGTVRHDLPYLRTYLAAEPAVAARWSEETDSDLADPGVLAGLLLKAALELNPESVVLFASRRPENIEANAAIAEDESAQGPARRLWELVQEETAKRRLTGRQVGRFSPPQSH